MFDIRSRLMLIAPHPDDEALACRAHLIRVSEESSNPQEILEPVRLFVQRSRLLLLAYVSCLLGT
jgi:hypothetical protein